MKPRKLLQDQSGATAVIVGLLIIVLVGFTALAIDIGHLLMVRNQLQNAADAGALAGAAVLYDEYGTSVNPGANQEAYDIATSNMAFSETGEIPAEAHWVADNDGDIQRGHWSFGLTDDMPRGFTPNASLLATELWNKTTEELDADPNFINAVRVKTRRETTPAASIFAGIFGYENFSLSTEAIGYIGFAGELAPGEIDQPLAICLESIVNKDGEYSCNIGRLINSSSKTDSNSGAWTNFSSGCSDSFDSNDLKDILDCSTNSCSDCDGSNENTISLGDGISVGGGQVSGGFSSLRLCGEFYTEKELSKDSTLIRRAQPWELTVPVIDCEGSSNPAGCMKVVGAVTIEIVMITDTFSEDETKKYVDVPTRMGDWDGSELTGKDRWVDFVRHFNLEIEPEISAEDHYYQTTTYATRNCRPYELVGKTGGENFGVLAKIPVLVNRPDDN